jgi:hypothetical protein
MIHIMFLNAHLEMLHAKYLSVGYNNVIQEDLNVFLYNLSLCILSDLRDMTNFDHRGNIYITYVDKHIQLDAKYLLLF